MSVTYIDIIGEKYPNVRVTSLGIGNVYEDLMHVGGDPIPSKAVLDADVLAQIKKLMWLKIQDERTRRQNGGVFINSVSKWFHSDQTSRIQQLGLVMMGASLPAGIMWKTMDGTFVEMTQTLANAIFNAVATLDQQAFGVAENHRVSMEASATPATYDFSGGWPAIYTG